MRLHATTTSLSAAAAHVHAAAATDRRCRDIIAAAHSPVNTVTAPDGTVHQVHVYPIDAMNGWEDEDWAGLRQALGLSTADLFSGLGKTGAVMISHDFAAAL